MKHLIIGTAGHIDHGKTALVKLLTNIDCDTHKEEKQRGITINLGFSHLDLPGGASAGIVDVPGHKDFIGTMVGGASGIDMVLLVIAADSGIMPQTIEHINIISALGINKGVVALTKTDLVDDELLEMATLEISDFLDSTSLKGAPIVGVSAVTGKGKDELLTSIEKIIETIEERNRGNLFRMYIDRIFTVKGFGSVVTGSVLGGSLSVGQNVFLLPGDHQNLRVRSIERHGRQVQTVSGGDRAAINIIGLKSEDFLRGMIISDKQLEATEMADAFITLFENIPEIGIWSNVTFISGTFECQARMHLLNKDLIAGKDDGIVQLHLNRPAILMNRDKFILRNSSADITLGGGYIVDAAPLHHRKRTSKLVESLEKLCVNILSDKSASENVNQLLKKEFRPFLFSEVADKLNIKAEELMETVNSKIAGFKVYENVGLILLISSHYDDSFKEKVMKIINEHHAANPMMAEGMEAGQIFGKLGFARSKAGKSYLEAMLETLLSDGKLEKVNNTLIIKGHQPKLDEKHLKNIKWLEHEILMCGDEKPIFSEIEEKAANQNISKHDFKKYLGLLASQSKIRFFQSDFLHTDILLKNQTLLMQHLSTNKNSINIQTFKEVIGGTKRFRALLLDMFEAQKIIQIRKTDDGEAMILITENGKQLIHESLS